MKKDQAAKIERRWQKFQEHLGYTNEELAIHRSIPTHVKAMEKASKFATHNIVIEVIESKNCGAEYEVGDKFVVDGEGCLVLNECPPRLCIAAIYSLKTLVDRMWQAFYEDSIEVLHNTVRCPDVGVQRGGWGEITMRVKAVRRKKQ
jgi:uncharacterized repeat protein (TIGR04076 family)